MDQGQTPLLTALVEHNQGGPLPFYVPGHKGGRDAPDALLELWGRAVFAYDATEVGDLDDLHAPTEAIARAEALAARAVGAAHTCFLTSGSTSGLLAAIMAVSFPGDKVLVPRNAHRSVLAGLILSGARPVYAWPLVDARTGIPQPLAVEAVDKALGRHPDLKAMVLLHPTYFGSVGETQVMIQRAKERGVRVVVDEAHGAHFPFSPAVFPPSALSMGADVVVQSWHKTLGALTGAAMLHCTGAGLDLLDRIRAFLRLVHTTSPSYLALASLDAARSHAATAPGSRWRRVGAYYAQVRECLAGVEEVSVYPGEINCHDPIKLVVKTKGFSARALAQEMTAHRMYPELVTDKICLFVLSTGVEGLVPAAELAESIGYAAGRASRTVMNGDSKDRAMLLWTQRPRAVMEPRSAALAPTDWVPLNDTRDRVVAELLVLYPPGSAIRCPGEVMDAETIEIMLVMLNEGHRFHGIGPSPEYPIAVMKAADDFSTRG